MNADAAKHMRGRRVFLIFIVIVGALVVFLLWLAFGSANQETIRFTIVNADTGAALTNVEVTAYRQKHPVLREFVEFTDGPLVHFEKLQVNSSGIVETVEPPGKRWLTVYFAPDSNFATVIFTRGPEGDSFSAPGQPPFAIYTGRTNRITIALQPKSGEAKP